MPRTKGIWAASRVNHPYLVTDTAPINLEVVDMWSSNNPLGNEGNGIVAGGAGALNNPIINSDCTFMFYFTKLTNGESELFTSLLPGGAFNNFRVSVSTGALAGQFKIQSRWLNSGVTQFDGTANHDGYVLGQIYHYAQTISASSGSSVYINGQLLETVPYSDGGMGNVGSHSNFAYDNRVADTNWTDIKTAFFRSYDVEMNAAEVLERYHGGVARAFELEDQTNMRAAYELANYTSRVNPNPLANLIGSPTDFSTVGVGATYETDTLMVEV